MSEQVLLEVLSRAKGSDPAASTQALAAACRDHYADCFRIHRATGDERLRAELRHALGIEAIEGAEVILRAAAPRGETAQGGVIDHHDLWLRFDRVSVLVADADAQRDHLLGQRLLLARGTHEDSWLFAQLEGAAEQQQNEQVWLLNRKLLTHVENDAGVMIYEFRCLPAAAADIVRGLRP